MNRKFIVSFELAKLLKEIGCDCTTNFYYRADGNFMIGIEVNNNILMEGNIAAPAYCELIDLFENVYGIYMECNIWYDQNIKKPVYWVHLFTKDEDFGADCDQFYYQSREDAYNAAFNYIIEENLLGK